MRVSLTLTAAVLVAGMAGTASAQTLEEFLRNPQVEQPVPICVIDPRFCEPGDPSNNNWRPNDDLMLMNLSPQENQMTMSGSDHGIMVIDPRRVFVGGGAVYIVPEGVQTPFIDRW